MPTLTSCFQATEIEDKPSTPEVTVSVGFAGFGISVKPLDTRAEEGTTIPENLNRISLAFFNQNNTLVKSLQQSKGTEGETFGSLNVTLPVGDYKLVAVVHEAKDGDAPATINSPQEVQLASSSIRDTYSTVINKVTISTSTRSIPISMGKRINATFRLKTTDVVPEGVASISIMATLGTGQMPNKPTFNPLSGLITSGWQHIVLLTAVVGETFDRTCNFLLPADEYSTTMAICARDATNNKLTQYQLNIDDVPLQRACQTIAEGAFFNRTGSIGFTFDETQGTHDITF